MEKILFDFIEELLTMEGIPHHRILCPCSDWDWLDLGLHSRILGIEDFSQEMNALYKSFKADTLYHYMDAFQCHYTIFRLEGEKEEEKQSYLVVGPVLFEHIYGARFESLFRCLALPEKLMEPLRNYYQNIPSIQNSSHYENTMAVMANFIYRKNSYNTVFQTEGDLENLRHHYGCISRVPEHPFLNLKYIEDRYDAENEILIAVGHGNEAHAFKSLKKLIRCGVPPRLSNTLRDKKDLTITLNSLMRKAVEQAGVHPIHIDSFSNASIQQLEQLTSISQCEVFMHRLVLGYCRLVKKYSIKGYSLPVQKAITCITSDLGADLGLKTLAEALNITPSYLSALFKKETGMTLTDYVSQQRIAYAQSLLLNTDAPIKSIAGQCGVADLNYFVRMFKRATGVTPKAYRDAAASSQQIQIQHNIGMI